MRTATHVRLAHGAFIRGMAATALLLAAAGSTAAAQGSTVVLRNNGSPFEVEVDRLVRELLQKQRVGVALVSNLQELQMALRTASLSDLQRSQVENTLRQLRVRLASLENDGARIQRRLSDICDAGRKPEGWVGIAYSVSASANRQDDGRVIMRFVDYPSIESVEPGSPADKAGIHGGDRILEMSGRDLRDAEIDFTPLLKPGTRIPFKVRRGVETKVLTVMVEPRPDDFSTPCPWVDERIAAALTPMQMTMTWSSDQAVTLPAMPNPSRVVLQRRVTTPTPPSPPTPVTASAAPLPPLPPPPVGLGASTATVVFGGAQFVAVSPELADALGVERGLLVVGVGRGSPAEQSGLRTGDVLMSANGQSLGSPLVFLQAVEQSTRRELRLQLIRRRKPMSATLSW